MFNKDIGKNEKRNLDGSPHRHGLTPVAKKSGYEEAQAHSGIQRYLDEIVTKATQAPLEKMATRLDNFEGQMASLNNNQMTMLNENRDFRTDIADYFKGLKIKGKVDHPKDDRVDTLEDKINGIQKDVHGMGENFNRFAGGVEALLVQKGFINAGDLYKQFQEGGQAKIEV